MAVWFGDLSSHGHEIPVVTSYLSGIGPPNRRPTAVVTDSRTLRLQGGGKNWRLAGDAVRGRYYDVRQGDFLFMDFEADERQLSWVVVRQGTDGPSIPGESDLYFSLASKLGDAKESMWTLFGTQATSIREQLVDFHQPCRTFFLKERDGTVSAPSSTASSGIAKSSNSPSYQKLLEAIGEPSPVSRTTGTSETNFRRSSLVRKAVLLRSSGQCENHACSGMPSDTTRAGEPILEVDHIVDLGLGGTDHPENAIALCPNCHAMKTRGKRSDHWRSVFLAIARDAHADELSQMNR